MSAGTIARVAASAFHEWVAFTSRGVWPSQPDGSVSTSEYEATLGRIITGDAETFKGYLNRTNVGVRGD